MGAVEERSLETGVPEDAVKSATEETGAAVFGDAIEDAKDSTSKDVSDSEVRENGTVVVPAGSDKLPTLVGTILLASDIMTLELVDNNTALRDSVEVASDVKASVGEMIVDPARTDKPPTIVGPILLDSHVVTLELVGNIIAPRDFVEDTSDVEAREGEIIVGAAGTDKVPTLTGAILLDSAIVILELNGGIIEPRDSIEDVCNTGACERAIRVDPSGTNELLKLEGATRLAAEIVALELNGGIIRLRDSVVEDRKDFEGCETRVTLVPVGTGRILSLVGVTLLASEIGILELPGAVREPGDPEVEDACDCEGREKEIAVVPGMAKLAALD